MRAFYLFETKDKAVWNPERKPTQIFNVDIEQVDTRIPTTTRVNIYSPGFCHIENLYLSNGIVYFVMDTPATIFGTQFTPITCLAMGIKWPDIPAPGQMESDEVKLISSAEFHAQFEVVDTWNDTTFISPQKENLISDYHFHFVEVVVGLWFSFLASVDAGSTSPAVVRAVFPEIGMNRIFDKNNLNSQLYNSVFGDSQFIDADMFKAVTGADITAGKKPAVAISSALTADRWCSRNFDGLAFAFGKMSLGLTHVLHTKDRMDRLLQRLWTAIEYDDRIKQQPTVLYVDRQSSKKRRLSDQAHASLVGELQTLRDSGWQVEIKKMEDLEWREQALLFSRADVVVALHGNALSYLPFMSPKGGLLELNAHDFKRFDYEWLSSVTGCKYQAIDDQGPYWQGRFTHTNRQDSEDYSAIEINATQVVEIVKSWKPNANLQWKYIH